MTVHFEKIASISTGNVGFYSIRFNNQEMNEYARFLKNDFSEHPIEYKILETVIKKMGIRGAKSYYFPKSEKGAFALPIVDLALQKANKKDFGIRLYCIHISESIVILLNGGIKTKNNPNECPNVSKAFDNAVKLEQKITKAQEEDLILFKGVTIFCDDNLTIEI